MRAMRVNMRVNVPAMQVNMQARQLLKGFCFKMGA